MSGSMQQAGRTTHVKVVVIAMLSSIVVGLVGFNARTTELEMKYSKSHIRVDGPIYRPDSGLREATSSTKNTIR